MKIIGLTVLATALLAAGSSEAQSRLSPGQTVRGTLSSSDAVLNDDSHFDCYALQTTAGQRYVIELRSADFDAFLSVGGAGDCTEMEDPEADDDSAGGTDSRLELDGDGGVWAVRANSLGGGETGAYTLSVATSAGQAMSGGSAAGNGDGVLALLAGRSRTGALSSDDRVADDRSYFDCYVFTAAAGQQVTVEMRSSAFDAYLSLYGGGTCSGDYIESDDDGAGGTDARISTAVPADGVYSVRANSLSAGSTGAYSISLAN